MGSNLSYSNFPQKKEVALLLPEECRAFGSAASLATLKSWMDTWSISPDNQITSLLVLAGSKTAEIEGISAAGATIESRRYTALADAELLLKGPSMQRIISLPPLNAGVSPALISYVASRLIGVKPLVVCAGLLTPPSFPCLIVDSLLLGPSECLTTGKAMEPNRVEKLWEKGFEMGLSSEKPLLLTECVPGGTTTALAVLTGLGISAWDCIGSSHRMPPKNLKKRLVLKGLKAAGLGKHTSPKQLLAAVGDPFQAFSSGLLLGARQARRQVLLGGGSQMLAVLATCLASVALSVRDDFVKGISIGTTAWLAEELISSSINLAAFPTLIQRLEDFFGVPLLGLASGVHFSTSSQKVLRDYEFGFVKEGVGAGAFLLLAQNNGVSCKKLIDDCEIAVDQLCQLS